MLTFLIWFLEIIGLILGSIGAITVYHIVRPQKVYKKCKARVYAAKLWWIALTREDIFVDIIKMMQEEQAEKMVYNSHNDEPHYMDALPKFDNIDEK
jgi:hypothetical protein